MNDFVGNATSLAFIAVIAVFIGLAFTAFNVVMRLLVLQQDDTLAKEPLTAYQEVTSCLIYLSKAVFTAIFIGALIVYRWTASLIMAVALKHPHRVQGGQQDWQFATVVVVLIALLLIGVFVLVRTKYKQCWSLLYKIPLQLRSQQ